MQRGSSLRSHHIGGCRGSSAASIVSTQVSIDDERSHQQSAAPAEDAVDRIIVATARAGKGVFIGEIRTRSLPLGATAARNARNERGDEAALRGVGYWKRREYRLATSPPPHRGNARPEHVIPSSTPASRSSLETLESWSAAALRVGRTVPAEERHAPHRPDFAGTTVKSLRHCAFDR